MAKVLVFRKKKVGKQADHRAEGPHEKTVTVFHVDYVKQKKYPIGTVVERRKGIRPDNLAGLLRIAREMYASTPQEALQTVLGRTIISPEE